MVFREGNENRFVRGRRILWKLDAYLATNALHGSVYDMEDLLNVVMVNDNLVQFIRHRQVKKTKSLSRDIAIYERALDGTKEKSYDFLYEAAYRYINAKRLEKNRDRIAKQAAAGMPSTPAPLKRVPGGFCIDFVRKGTCTKEDCSYKHEKPEKSRGRTPSECRAFTRGAAAQDVAVAAVGCL